MTNAPNGWDQAGRSTDTVAVRTDIRGRRRPGQARSVFAELHIWLNATTEQRRLWSHCATVARESAAHNKARILAHPDLAARLAALYGLSRAENWSGYIPPTIGHITNEGHRAIINRSPYRAELLELLAEATHRVAP